MEAQNGKLGIPFERFNFISSIREFLNEITKRL